VAICAEKHGSGVRRLTAAESVAATGAGLLVTISGAIAASVISAAVGLSVHDQAFSQMLCCFSVSGGSPTIDGQHQ